MKNRLLHGFVISSLMLLGACSATPNVMVKRQVDTDYVNQVEAAARKNSQTPRIYWVNPPLKKQEKQQQPQS